MEQIKLRERVALAFILSKSSDKERCKSYFAGSHDRIHLIGVAYHLFLLSQKTSAMADIVEGEFQLTIGTDPKFTFRLVPVLRRDKGPFVHDFLPFTDIFVLGEYDFEYGNGIVVDVGGYLGDTAVFFSKRGAKKVFVYEPNPINFNYLLMNLKLNGVSDSIVPFNCGVSSEKRTFVVPSDMGGGGSFFSQKDGNPTFEVQTIEPSAIFQGKGIIDLLKLDCKGCETEIFSNCLPELRSQVKHIIAEVERLKSTQTHQIVHNLTTNGFKLEKIDDFYPTIYLTNELLLEDTS